MSLRATHSGTFAQTKPTTILEPEHRPVLWTGGDWRTSGLQVNKLSRSQVRAAQWRKAQQEYMKHREKVDMVSHGTWGETECRGNYTRQKPIPNIMYARNVVHPKKSYGTVNTNVPTPGSFYKTEFVQHRFPTSRTMVDDAPERIEWMLSRDYPATPGSEFARSFSEPQMRMLSDHKVYGRNVDHEYRQCGAATCPTPTPASSYQDAFTAKLKRLPRTVYGYTF
jgi:hypothetical protein